MVARTRPRRARCIHGETQMESPLRGHAPLQKSQTTIAHSTTPAHRQALGSAFRANTAGRAQCAPHRSQAFGGN
eukprot:9229936-Pyramimonas_sp.AAC.1